MSAREAILGRVRTALGRTGQRGLSEPPPPVRIGFTDVSVENRIGQFCVALEKLAGKTLVAGSMQEARDYVLSVIGNGTYMTSNSPFLKACGIERVVDLAHHREACSQVDFGVTSAEYALADTGSLVMFSNSEEARLISLLPPVHIAIIRRDQILTGLDELLIRVPLPGDHTSAMVLITGPSRTADIEQILIRGVHGPGEQHVVIV